MTTFSVHVQDPVGGTATAYFDSVTHQLIAQDGIIHEPFRDQWERIIKQYMNDPAYTVTMETEIKKKIEPWMEIDDNGWDRKVVELLWKGWRYTEIYVEYHFASAERMRNRVSDLRKLGKKIPTQEEIRKIRGYKSRDTP